MLHCQVFFGRSTSKKKAKLQAAESAIHSLLGEPPDVVASTPSAGGVGTAALSAGSDADDQAPFFLSLLSAGSLAQR